MVLALVLVVEAIGAMASFWAVVFPASVFGFSPSPSPSPSVLLYLTTPSLLSSPSSSSPSHSSSSSTSSTTASTAPRRLICRPFSLSLSRRLRLRCRCAVMLLLRAMIGGAVAAAVAAMIGALGEGADAGEVGDDIGEVGEDGETMILISDFFVREYPLLLLPSADAEAETDGRSGIGWWWPLYRYLVTHSYSVIFVPRTRVWMRRYTKVALRMKAKNDISYAQEGGFRSRARP